MNRLDPLAPIGRVLFALLFVDAALGHFKPETVAYAQASGVPLANLAVPASGVLALVAALSIAVGYRARWGAIGIVAFLVPVTLMMHKFWAISDPGMAQLQRIMFLKNVSLVGAALYLAYAGAGALSLDARLRRRAARGDDRLDAAAAGSTAYSA
ncbi:MAG: DoxX family protein [Kofleriaceae bacterium]|nr:DoxX family protein [Myxococcales bacterium]MCB9570852.1 DoxX family protein [Kofleriaceae bacterium]